MRVARSSPVAAVLVMVLGQCVAVGQATDSAPEGAEHRVELPAHADAGEQINLLRVSNGLTPMRPNAALKRAAAAHLRDMAANDFMDHEGSDGRGVRARGRAQGYRACWIAESLASGQRTPSEVVEAWDRSPKHRRIMMHRRAEEYGLARGGSNLWVLVVAEPGCR